MRARSAMLIQIRFGLEGDSAERARIRPFVRVRPDVLLKDTGLGPRHRAVRARVTTLPGLGGGLDSPCRLRGRFELAAEFLRRLLAALVVFLSLGHLTRDDVVCRALLLDDFRRNFSRRHLLEFLVQVLWLAIVVVIVVIVVVVVIGQLWVCHRHSMGLCKQRDTRYF